MSIPRDERSVWVKEKLEKMLANAEEKVKEQEEMESLEVTDKMYERLIVSYTKRQRIQQEEKMRKSREEKGEIEIEQ